jgi:serralysin
MATITFGKALDDWSWLEDFYDMNQLKLVSKTAAKAVYRDANGDQIVLTGSGFAFNGSFATKGMVTGVQFISGAGEKFLAISGASFKASAVFAEIKDKSFFDLLSVLTAGSDVIKGTESGNDIIIGTNKGNDKIYGLGGDDFIKGSAGNNLIDGGSGWNTLSYTETFWHRDGVKSGVTVDVVKGTVKNSWGGTDTVKNVQGYEGTHLVDRFNGGNANDSFMGLRGNDTLVGGKGLDEARYYKDAKYDGKLGIVADLVKGKIKDGFGTVDTIKSIERVIGTKFNDVFKGDAEDNHFRGLQGKDRFDGGAGTDTVSFDFHETYKGQKGIVVDLRKTTGQIVNDGFGNTENAKSIEVVDGSHLNDRITLGSAEGGAWGAAGNDYLSAGKGKNWLSGGDGDDRLVAGASENWLSGGDGKDTFVFASAKDSMKGTITRDFIEDFSRSDGDRIDLSALDVSFKNVKTTVNTNGDTIVTVDAAGSIDLQFLIDGNLTLKASDFIF